MNYIELIGPQGAGKSELLQLLVEKRNKTASWITYQEAVSDIVDSIRWNQLKKINNKLLYLLNKVNFVQYKEIGIHNTLISGFTEDIPHTIQKKYEYLMDAQFKCLESMELNISSINKYSLLSWHWNALNRVFILETLNYKKTVLLDEGPLKTHYGLFHINGKQINKETLPKAVIYCSIDLKQNLKRIEKRRIATGKLSKMHNDLNNEDMDCLVTSTHEIATKNFSYIKNLGIPTIEIDLSDSIIDSDLEKLNQFIAVHTNAT